MGCTGSILKTILFGTVGAGGVAGAIGWDSNFWKIFGGAVAVVTIPLALYYGKDTKECVTIRGAHRKSKYKK